MVQYFKNILYSSKNVCLDSLLEEEAIPNLIDDRMNQILTMIPSAEEIKDVVFYLNTDGAPNLDGFGALFLTIRIFFKILSLIVLLNSHQKPVASKFQC